MATLPPSSTVHAASFPLSATTTTLPTVHAAFVLHPHAFRGPCLIYSSPLRALNTATLSSMRPIRDSDKVRWSPASKTSHHHCDLRSPRLHGASSLPRLETSTPSRYPYWRRWDTPRVSQPPASFTLLYRALNLQEWQALSCLEHCCAVVDATHPRQGHGTSVAEVEDLMPPPRLEAFTPSRYPSPRPTAELLWVLGTCLLSSSSVRDLLLVVCTLSFVDSWKPLDLPPISYYPHHHELSTFLRP
jgi:hypothetical protein